MGYKFSGNKGKLVEVEKDLNCKLKKCKINTMDETVMIWKMQPDGKTPKY